MKLKNTTTRYYPFKVRGGFKVCGTRQPSKSLGFATFKTKKVARYMGMLWYGGIEKSCKVCSVR